MHPCMHSVINNLFYTTKNIYNYLIYNRVYIRNSLNDDLFDIKSIVESKIVVAAA